MKNLIFKNSYRFLVPVMVTFGVLMGASVAIAGWNDASSGECPTFSVANVSTNDGLGSPCWNKTVVSGNVGDTINVKVYFHNNTGVTANDVRVRVVDNRGAVGGGSQGVYTAGTVTSGGAVVASGYGTINIPANTRLVYQRTVVQYQKTGFAVEDKGATATIFEAALSGGLQVGPVASTWADQGVVKVVYRIESTGTTPPVSTVPDVETGNVSVSGTSATMNGSYSSDIVPVTACFEYRRDNGSIINKIVGSYSTLVKSFTLAQSGLADGDYQYRACATNSAGTGHGDWRSFTIGDGYVQPPTSDLRTTTLSPEIIDRFDGDVNLRGQYTGNESGSARTYFEYRRNNGSTITTGSNTYGNESRSFSRILSGLSSGDYQYRACAENNTELDCGVWRTFTIDRTTYNPPTSTDELPTVQTLNPIQYGSTFVTFDGYFAMNGCSGQTHFEWGTSTSFGNRTASASHTGSATGSMAQFVSTLSPSNTYYYRAVAENCEGITRGVTRSFRTVAQTTVVNDNNTVVVNTTTTRNTVTNTNIGGGSAFIRLTIDNGRDSVMRNDELVYDVEWENITRTDLDDLVLEVSFPEGLQIMSTDRGQLDRPANKVYVNIRELRALERDDMTIRARVVSTSLRDGDPVTARAIIAFENPNNRAQENAIAYDSDTYYAASNVLGASLFGLGFLPGTLAGWLFLILLIILLILVIRYTTRRFETRYQTTNHYAAPTPAPRAPEQPVYDAVDYEPYRPTPKE